MKRWAILTIFLYALALIVLTLPVTLIAFADWGRNHMNMGFSEVLSFYCRWGYWVWLGVLLAGQALLLLLPIQLADRRLPARRPLKVPVIVTAFLLANLCFAGLFSVLCAIFTDQAFQLFDLTRWFRSGADQAGQNDSSASGFGLTLLFTVLAFWVVWALVLFRNFAKSDESDALIQRTTRWLLRGSILELIVAVPSHVIVRRRDDCCAPVGTFWGIATGISIMLLCFGPGVFFLFVERCRRLRPRQNSMDSNL